MGKNKDKQSYKQDRQKKIEKKRQREMRTLRKFKRRVGM
tara:strand:+ start:287 stop:403 length:117 start_codon:yes stop_codon:yes gene_type:complete